MPLRLYLRLAELLVTAIFAATIVVAWHAERRERTQLAAELATAKQALTQADARQHDRDTQLIQTLSTLAAEKRTVTSPTQIVRELPKQIGLPTPIELQTEPSQTESQPQSQSGTTTNANPRNPKAPNQTPSTSQQQAVIPEADLKPLYDFTLDCKACQAKLTVAQADLTDERAKTTTLTKERDAALKAAKGGTILHRIAQAAKWFAIGAFAGAVAARAH